MNTFSDISVAHVFPCRSLGKRFPRAGIDSSLSPELVVNTAGSEPYRAESGRAIPIPLTFVYPQYNFVTTVVYIYVNYFNKLDQHSQPEHPAKAFFRSYLFEL